MVDGVLRRMNNPMLLEDPSLFQASSRVDATIQVKDGSCTSLWHFPFFALFVGEIGTLPCAPIHLLVSSITGLKLNMKSLCQHIFRSVAVDDRFLLFNCRAVLASQGQKVGLTQGACDMG